MLGTIGDSMENVKSNSPILYSVVRLKKRIMSEGFE